MSINNIEIQDSNANIYYPHTDAGIVKYGNTDVGTMLNALMYQTAGGTATALTVTTPALVNGLPVNIIASLANGGAATTVNGKPLYKSGTTVAPNLKAGRPYTIVYNLTGNCFFIKASAEGNTIASHVLAGETFSNDNGIDVGTMVNRNYMENSAGVWTDEIGTIALKLPIGAYINEGGFGPGYAAPCFHDANFLSKNIAKGVPMLGLVGTFSGGCNFAYGVVEDAHPLTVTGLSFTPIAVLVKYGQTEAENSAGKICYGGYTIGDQYITINFLGFTFNTQGYAEWYAWGF